MSKEIELWFRGSDGTFVRAATLRNVVIHQQTEEIEPINGWKRFQCVGEPTITAVVADLKPANGHLAL